MTSIFQAGQPFNLVRTSNATYQASDKDLVISSGDEVALPSPNQGATVLVRPAPSTDSVKITTSNGTIGNTGNTFGIYSATEPIYLVGDGTNWYARSGGGEISAIPDAAIHQYDASTLTLNNGDTVSNWTDEIGSADASANSNPSYQDNSLNGLPVVDFDGDDSFDASFSLSQPYSMTAVVKLDSATGYLWSSDTGGAHPHFQPLDSTTIRFDAGSQADFTVSNYTGNYVIFTSIYNGSNSVLRRDGSIVATKDAGTDGISADFRIGRRSTFINGQIAELVIYDADISGQTVSEEETRLSNKWGITI